MIGIAEMFDEYSRVDPFDEQFCIEWWARLRREQANERTRRSRESLMRNPARRERRKKYKRNYMRTYMREYSKRKASDPAYLERRRETQRRYEAKRRAARQAIPSAEQRRAA